MSRERIQYIVSSILCGSTEPILGLRLLLPYRDFFGDISNPVANAITGLESQTDHLIFQGENLINRSAISDEDLKYFNNQTLDVARNISELLSMSRN